jgi:mannose-1-phosphate guanylyltransferase
MARMKTVPVYAVILAGGQSSRLFPFNKVLSDFTGSGRSLIQQAHDRLDLLSDRQIYVLTARPMVFPMRRQLGLPSSHFFIDPARRGTWPALLWAMAHLRAKNPHAVMAVVTGDHVIPKVREFQRAFKQAVRTAAQHAAFVVVPVKSSKDLKEWQSFGSVKSASSSSGAASVPLAGFEEKPSLQRAERMRQEGGWYWNAGMFFFRVSVAEEVLETYQPAMSRIYHRMAEALLRHQSTRAAAIFKSFPEKIPHPLTPQKWVDNTIDYAVMMPLVRRASAAASAWMTRQALTRWTDLGQWTALRQVVASDRHGNIRIGDIRVDSSVRNSILVAERGHRIEVSGVKDLIVALAGGKALVLPASEVSRVKELVSASKGRSRIIGKMPYIASFALSKRRNVVILTNKRKEAI